MDALAQVQRCWHDLARRRSCATPVADAALAEIVAAYREMHRHYHTLHHIAAMLALLGRDAHPAADRDALELAILFHDVVYNPAGRDNEAASAAFAADRLRRLGFPEALIAKVTRYILATQHDVSCASAGDPDLALLLDLDLSILGGTPAEYRAYARAVRREYAFVPDPFYRTGRRRVLEGFLARRQIYRTRRLRDLWEGPARANLAAEIAELGIGT